MEYLDRTGLSKLFKKNNYFWDGSLRQAYFFSWVYEEQHCVDSANIGDPIVDCGYCNHQ